MQVKHIENIVFIQRNDDLFTHCIWGALICPRLGTNLSARPKNRRVQWNLYQERDHQQRFAYKEIA